MGLGTGVKTTLRSLQSGRPSSLGAIWGDSGTVSRSPLGKSNLGTVKGDNGSITHRPGYGVQGGLGTISGDKGAINHRPGFGNIGSKGGQLTDSGAIGKHHGFSPIGGLNHIRGNAGAIKRSTLSEVDRYTLGAARGDSGAIRRAPISATARYTLGETRGNSGAITRTNTFFATGALGAVRGDSGAISGSGRGSFQLVASPLGGRSGDSGAISRTPVNATARYTLGAVRGDSGAISRSFSGMGSRGGLGNTFGNAGAIKQSGGRSGGLSNSGSTGRGSGSGGGLSRGAKKVGGSSKARSGNSTFKPRAPIIRRKCCGDAVNGTFNVEIEWEYDEEWGVLKPAVTRQFEAIVNGRDCTPEKWGFVSIASADGVIYDSIDLWLRGTTSGQVVESATLITQETDGGHGFCATVKMDVPNNRGKVLARVRIPLDRDEDKVLMAQSGRMQRVGRMGVWPREQS